MKRKRRNHGPAFKARVALAALKGDKTLVEISPQYQVYQSQILAWKQQLAEHAEEVFSRGAKMEAGPALNDMQAKIVQLALENDFLSAAIGSGATTELSLGVNEDLPFDCFALPPSSRIVLAVKDVVCLDLEHNNGRQSA